MTEVEVDEICPDALHGQRVDRVVALIADMSRSQAAELISGGRVVVDGSPVSKPALKVAAGSRIQFAHERQASGIEPDAAVTVPVLYVDDQVIVVDKPAGLVMHPGAGVASGTMAQGLLARFPELAEVGEPIRPGIVHRLDKGTSGVLMVARTALAHEALSRQLAERTVERVYHTVVGGHVEAERGVIDAPLGRSPRDPAIRAVIAAGRPARTRYAVRQRGHLVGSGVAVTELECRLETGRTHQIRAHLAAIDHPVLGDSAYGGPAGAAAVGAGGLLRPFLHAGTLGFRHPSSGEQLRFSSPLPADLAAVLALLRSDR